MSNPHDSQLRHDLDIISPLLTNAEAWTRQITQLNASIHREWLHFVDKRLKEDAAFGQSLAACKAPDDIMRVYTSFYHTAFEHYQKEFSALAHLGASLATEAIEEAKSDSSLMDPQLSAAGGTPALHASERRPDVSAPATSH